MNQNLDSFARELQMEVLLGCAADDAETFREDHFTEIVGQYLEEAGELEGIEICSHRARGLQVNGYALSPDGHTLDLLITEYSGLVPPGSLTRTAVQTSFRRLRVFLGKCLDGYYRLIEEASRVFDMAQQIHEASESLLRVRLYLLSDLVATHDPISDEDLGAMRISHHVWDVERLFRSWTSGKQREVVRIDFEHIHGNPIPCLMTSEPGADYATYLAVLPAAVLVRVYGDHGNRLLERNVRAFLQTRGKINSGIRQTILREPEMFLAFNNGISITAEAAEVVPMASGGFGIRSVDDFQIVNGGQTTASLYQAAIKDNADVSHIGVQAKITVVNDPGKMDSLVPRISLFANSQNKVQSADFSANDPFHRAVEELSRTVWAPAVEGAQHQTRWYYDRARGQYVNDRERERTPAAKRRFELIHPSAQRFTKTDLAKFENTWNQLPHIVSRGAEKNFQEFTVRLRERGGFEPDVHYFERLVAKAILFRSAEKLVGSQKYGGYRANIVTYTLAYLSHATAQRIYLEVIWRKQGLTGALEQAIVCISRAAHDHIVAAPGNGNVTEWCKREECWKRFRERGDQVPDALLSELTGDVQITERRPDSGVQGSDERDRVLIHAVTGVAGETWFAISAWAKETGNLQPWQRSLSYSIGRIVSQGREPTRKQAHQASNILEEARRLGFRE